MRRAPEIIFAGFLACAVAATRANAADFTNGIVATVHPLATEAGLNILKHGGNAVDATVAVALTLGVVNGENSGIGGGCFMLIRRANGELVAIDGRETAPAAATRDMFVPNGKSNTALSQTGALASGVPGSVAAYEFAVTHYGRKKFSELLLPAADLAEQGFVVDRSYARTLTAEAADLARFEASRAIYFRNGKPLREGDRLQQPDLARTYRNIASQGSAWFYRGTFAEATAAWMRQNAGLLTFDDFKNYQIKLREPIVSSYRGYQIIGFPPPSSGGVHVAQILNMLQQFDLKSLGEGARLHLVAEAMKLAFADRAYWLGDPDFAAVPRGLTQEAYAKQLASKIDPQHARKVESHGEPPGWQSDTFKKHTTHFSVADAEGNWVACTATVNTSFGSKVTIPGTGVMMNNQMDDFSVQPGTTNFFGLIGAEANAVGPGKRPLSSMSPTIVLKDGQPMLALGAAGGPRIISAVVLELIEMLDLGMAPEKAVASARIHHQWFPDRLVVERSLPIPLQRDLHKRGHELEIVGSIAVSQIVGRASAGHSFTGAADPRASGMVAGW